MRDILVTLIVFGSIPFILRKPYIGVLVWSWLSYMNPHRLGWGFAYDMPFAQIVAIVMFVAVIFSKEKKRIPLTATTVIWIIFLIWMGVTTIFAYFPDEAFVQYKKIIKIQLVTFLTMMLMTDIDRIRRLIWVIVLSIGYFTVKGGVFTLLTGGGYRVWGPPDSFIEGNNELAVAGLMIIPLMVYMYQIYEKKTIKYGMIIAIILSVFTILGTQSRGALIAILAVGIYFWLKSRRKLASGFFIAIMVVSLLAFMPESWYSRMETIETYEQDRSAMGRLNAWQYAINAANDKVFGVGLDAWSLDTFTLYAPNPADVHAAHSIYFSVLADHGWIGLLLFLMIFYLAWRSLVIVIKESNGKEELKEFNILAKMLQVGFISYFVGGAFLSLSYFDLPWHYACFAVLLKDQLNKRIKQQHFKDTR